jgi:hypothetical protein
VSVEAKSDGNLRLRCDVEDCERKFVPRRPFQTPAPLRLRAALYGWFSSINTLDLCPTHSKEREE